MVNLCKMNNTLGLAAKLVVSGSLCALQIRIKPHVKMCPVKQSFERVSGRLFSSSNILTIKG